MAGTIVVDRIESDASYASNINIASQITFSNTVNMTVASTFPAGTVGAPSITTTGDTNTGIFFPAADTIAFSEGGAEAMRIDSSGNVGIGTSSPSTYANGFGPVLVAGTGNNFATVQGRTDGPSGAANGVSYGGSYQSNPINGARMFVGAAGGAGQRGIIIFNTKDLDDNSTQPVERARIESSGNLLVGTTTAHGLVTSAKSSGFCFATNSVGNGADHILFTNSGTTVGSINRVGSTGVIYNTTSDYRAKEDITPMTGALARNALLNPVKYKWKVDDSEGEGFIAHQLQGSFPNAVTGEKDAVDADGNPVYQGIGTGPLDGHFAACVNELQTIIQEQQALITALTTRITALESA